MNLFLQFLIVFIYFENILSSYMFINIQKSESVVIVSNYSIFLPLNIFRLNYTSPNIVLALFQVQIFLFYWVYVRFWYIRIIRLCLFSPF